MLGFFNSFHLNFRSQDIFAAKHQSTIFSPIALQFQLFFVILPRIFIKINGTNI